MTTEFVPLPPDLAELIDTWPREIERISPWAITQYRKCPEQFRRVVIHREYAKPAGAQIRGRAGHAAHEYNFAQKKESAFDLSTSEVRQYLQDQAWPMEVMEVGGVGEISWEKEASFFGLDRPRSLRRKREVADKVLTMTTTLVESYHQEVSYQLQPVSIEERFEITVPGIPTVIKGRTDLVAWRVMPGIDHKPTISVIDHKFTGNKKLKNDQRYVQGPMYALGMGLPVDFHFSLTQKLPRVDAFDPEYHIPKLSAKKKERLLASLRGTMLQIAYLYRTLGPNQPWPDALTHDWACSYCGFGPKGDKTCHWWH